MTVHFVSAQPSQRHCYPSFCLTPAPTTHHQEILASLDVVAVQSRSHPLVSGRSSVSDLARYDWIVNPQGCGYRAELERVMEEHGQELRVGVDAYGTEMQLRLVGAGLGLGIVSKSILALSRHRDELSIIDLKDFKFCIDVSVLHQSSVGNLAKPIALLRDVIAEKILAVESPPPLRKRRS